MKHVRLLLALGLLTRPGFLPAQTPVITRGPYLQMATPTAMTLRWRTSTATTGRIRFGTDAQNLTGSATEAAPGTDHALRLTNLAPATRYFYAVEAVGSPPLESGPEHSFTTPPPPGTVPTTRVWVLGDFGNDGGNFGRQDSVIASFKHFMQQNALPPMDLWLWLGDNAYDGGRDVEYQTAVFDKTAARYDWMLRKTPFYATPGNHEYYYPGGTPVRTPTNRANHDIDYFKIVDHYKHAEAGGEPSGTERYYSFNHGNIHFVSLDTWGTDAPHATQAGAEASILALGTPQRNWLRRDLQKTQADPSLHWTVVFTHMPPYSGQTHNSDVETDLTNVRENLVPLLDSFKVDLLLTGHDHAYLRTRLMRGHRGTSNTFSATTHTPELRSNAHSSGRLDGSPNSCFYYKHRSSTRNEGLVYVVNGAGGRAEYVPSKNKPLLQALTQSTTTTGGSVYLEVTGKRLDFKFIGANNRVLDQFTMFKDVEGFPVPLTDGTVRTAACECTEALDRGPFTHYTDAQGNLLLSIAKGGRNIGTAGVAPFDLKLQGVAGATNLNANSPANYIRPGPFKYRGVGAPWRVFNRHYTLKPGVELTDNQQVVVRQYYRETDLTALNVPYADDPMTHGNLKFLKVNDGPTPYNLAPSGGHADIPQAKAFNRPGAWVYDARVDGPDTPYGTTYLWKRGTLGNGTYFGEHAVGRLAGGGGIGAPTNFRTNPSGTKEQILSNIGNFLVGRTAPPADWKSNPFLDVSSWGRGYLPVGYSPRREDGELTLVPTGCPAPNDTNTNCATKAITTYYRGFAFLDPYEMQYFKAFILNYKRDDGVVIYINGREVLPRDPNMPQTPRVIYDTTKALNATNDLETEWKTVVIPNDGSYLREGLNLIAAEVHQVSEGSGDLHLNLELVGTPDATASPAATRLAAEPANESPAVTMFPNPADGNRVRFEPPLEYQSFRLTDARGVVYRQSAGPGMLRELDVSGLPPGVYALVGETADGGRYRFKLLRP